MAERHASSRALSWFVGCVAGGWLIVYNVMRVGGSSPAEAARPALGIGAAGGVVVLALGVLAQRPQAAGWPWRGCGAGGGLVVCPRGARARGRVGAQGRVVRSGPASIPSPAEMDGGQRDAIRLAWAPLGALALVALAVGAYLAADWFAADAGDRPKTTIILALWNVLAGLWLGDEALRLRRGEPDGIESIVLGCTLTAVLAGVGFSRDLAQPGQVALIVLTAVAGALVAVAVWRLQGARGYPVGAAGAVVVAALSLILPVVL